MTNNRDNTVKQIFFTIQQAAQYLFPDRPGRGGEQALRRMIKGKEIDVTWSGIQVLISRATLLSFGVQFDQSLEAVKVGSDQLESAGNPEEKEIVKDYDDDDCDFPY